MIFPMKNGNDMVTVDVPIRHKRAPAILPYSGFANRKRRMMSDFRVRGPLGRLSEPVPLREDARFSPTGSLLEPDRE